MFNLVIFGAPGSGKGTQSEQLINRYGLHHISTGEVLRDHIARGTKLGILADQYISKGQLIPDDLMISILADILDNDPNAAKGVILDGFPRTIPQAQALERMFDARGTKLHAVVGLDVPEEELVDRLIKRGQQSGRSDDNLDTIRKRLDVYHNQTQPLREYYESKGSYHNINGHGSVEEIFKSISDTLDPISAANAELPELPAAE